MTVNAGYSTRLQHEHEHYSPNHNPPLAFAAVPLKCLSPTTAIREETHPKTPSGASSEPMGVEIAPSMAKYAIFASCAKKDAPARRGCLRAVEIVFNVMKVGSHIAGGRKGATLAAARDPETRAFIGQAAKEMRDMLRGAARRLSTCGLSFAIIFRACVIFFFRVPDLIHSSFPARYPKLFSPASAADAADHYNWWMKVGFIRSSTHEAVDLPDYHWILYTCPPSESLEVLIGIISILSRMKYGYAGSAKFQHLPEINPKPSIV
ncbi:hypothetical protein DFH06DRAFT_1134139 [Mycena polygramma]|nr:hypothetical protein DFH06DRAFT_1134139 [Mycena polygramma]